MPITYQIDTSRGVIRTRCVGDVRLPDVLGHFRQLQIDDNRPARLDVILDLTETTSLPSSDQLREVSEAIGRIRNDVQFRACAIVTDSDAWFGTAQVFEVLAARNFTATKVFREIGEAEAWITARRSVS